MTWWHYTTTVGLTGALADNNTLRRATAGIDLRAGERPVVWFTSRPTWEPTATKRRVNPQGEERMATIPEMVAAAGPLIRIGFNADVARHTWQAYRHLSRVHPGIADALEAYARRMGSDPGDWRVSFHDVPLAKATAVETSPDGNEWEVVGQSVDGQLCFDADYVTGIGVTWDR